MELTPKDRANLCIFNICTGQSNQSDVHKNWVSHLLRIAYALNDFKNFRNVEEDVFFMSHELKVMCDSWYKDKEVKIEADKIWKQYGN
jgi:hypothetical protein